MSTIAAMAAILPILVTTAIAWLGTRGQEARRSRLIDLAQKRVYFLNIFLTTQSLATSPEQFEIMKRSVAEETIKIRLELIRNINELDISRSKPGDSNALQTFFLWYGLQSIPAHIFRILFYIFLVFSTMGSLGVVVLSGNNNSDFSGPGVIFLLIGSVLLYVLPALLFRWLAIVTNKNSQRRNTP